MGNLRTCGIAEHPLVDVLHGRESTTLVDIVTSLVVAFGLVYDVIGSQACISRVVHLKVCGQVANIAVTMTSTMLRGIKKRWRCVPPSANSMCESRLGRESVKGRVSLGSVAILGL